jgi:hypothetical protein
MQQAPRRRNPKTAPRFSQCRESTECTVPVATRGTRSIQPQPRCLSPRALRLPARGREPSHVARRAHSSQTARDVATWAPCRSARSSPVPATGSGGAWSIDDAHARRWGSLVAIPKTDEVNTIAAAGDAGSASERARGAFSRSSTSRRRPAAGVPGPHVRRHERGRARHADGHRGPGALATRHRGLGALRDVEQPPPTRVRATTSRGMRPRRALPPTWRPPHPARPRPERPSGGPSEHQSCVEITPPSGVAAKLPAGWRHVVDRASAASPHSFGVQTLVGF